MCHFDRTASNVKHHALALMCQIHPAPLSPSFAKLLLTLRLGLGSSSDPAVSLAHGTFHNDWLQFYHCCPPN